VAAFYAKIPGSANASDTVGAGFYTFPCDSTLPAVSFTLGGQDIPFTNTLNFGPVSSGSSDCVGGLVADDSIGSRKWFVQPQTISNRLFRVLHLGRCANVERLYRV
jgi:hypothetical protein